MTSITGNPATKHYFLRNSENFLGDFRRYNSKTVTHIRKIKCKLNFTQTILCSDTMKHKQNGFPNKMAFQTKWLPKQNGFPNNP